VHRVDKNLLTLDCLAQRLDFFAQVIPLARCPR